MIKRKSKQLKTKPVALIVCEGKETEPNYLGGFRKERRLSTLVIQIIGGVGDPQKIVEEAIKKKHMIDPDSTWCVFDKDDHDKGEKNKERWETAFALAKKYKINIALTNPAFELWLLLHFQDQAASLHRKEAKKSLEKHISDYEKNLSDMYDRTKEKMPEAHRRAQYLRKMHQENGDSEQENPSTGVDELMKFLDKTFPQD